MKNQWGPLSSKIKDVYDDLPPQLQAAARFVLTRPQDVALLSMREQARRCGVQPATMLRLANRLGFDSYETVRTFYANALRREGLGLAGKSSARAAGSNREGTLTLAAQVVEAANANVSALLDPSRLSTLEAMAQRLATAEHVYCLGLRGCYAPMWHFHYMMSLLARPATLLDAAAWTGFDPIRKATKEDVLLVASVDPYTRFSIRVAHHFKHLGIRVLALTDSEASPLALFSDSVFLVNTESPSFYHDVSSIFVACAALASLVAAHDPNATAQSLRATEEHLLALDLHVPTAPKKSKRAKAGK